MIMSEEHEAIHFAAQEVCNGLTKEEYAALNQRARVALAQLAIYAGCTNVEWWPDWAPKAAEIAEKVGSGDQKR
jgi:hypothetical protein